MNKLCLEKKGKQLRCGIGELKDGAMLTQSSSATGNSLCCVLTEWHSGVL